MHSAFQFTCFMVTEFHTFCLCTRKQLPAKYTERFWHFMRWITLIFDWTTSKIYVTGVIAISNQFAKFRQQLSSNRRNAAKDKQTNKLWDECINEVPSITTVVEKKSTAKLQNTESAFSISTIPDSGRWLWYNADSTSSNETPVRTKTWTAAGSSFTDTAHNNEPIAGHHYFRQSTSVVLICLVANGIIKLVTWQLADKPTRGQSNRGLVNSRTSQLAEMFDL